MKKAMILGLLLMLLCAPVLSAAQPVCMRQIADGESALVAFELAQDHALSDMTAMAVSMQIEARFAQQAAQAALARAGASISQEGWLYQDEALISMAHLWRGEQADGSEGCTAAALTLRADSGMEIYLDELFDDFDSALAAMEAIIKTDVLETMSDYMEYADLLPMPTGSFFVDQTGLTVYWPQERYRYFDGTCGSVTFYWHELRDYIGEGSPVYALSRAQQGAEAAMAEMLGTPLGDLAHALADPDYTSDALVFPLERVRGYSVEIPKYAQTQQDMTPVSAVRCSRVRLLGIETGRSAREEIIAALGEPQRTHVYDGDEAQAMMLSPGESLIYDQGAYVLEAHLDESGVLSCVILHAALPERLY